MERDAMDLVFQALANPVRRRILDLLKARPGQCTHDLCSRFEISRIALIKHLRVLEESQLIVLQKAGRKKELYFNVVPIQQIYDRWTSEYAGFWAAKTVDLKRELECAINATKASKSPAASEASKRRSEGSTSSRSSRSKR